MLSALRSSTVSRVSIRAFSTSSTRQYDLAKLTLIGRLGKDPDVRTSKNGNEYISYTVATTNYPPPPANPDGSRAESRTTWHHIMSFNPFANTFLKTLEKGAHVYVEANFELREPDPNAENSSPQGQRQIFLRHETIRVLGNRPHKNEQQNNLD